MVGGNYFRESYHDHRCLIVPEKDVLQVDIRGSGFIVFIKRWWNDLFLLSYDDRRSRIYFTSSRNMSMERFKQYRQYRSRIHPLSKFRNFWDCLMVNVFILEKMVFHHNTSVLFGKMFYMFFYYVAFALEMIIIADLFVNLETGYIHKPSKKIILNTHLGIRNYCSTKLFLHSVSAIPLQCLMYLRLGDDIDCALSKTNYFVCVLRIINMCSLYRIYESTKYWTRAREPSSVTYFFKFLRILVVSFISMLQLYDVSDTIGLMMIKWSGQVDEKSFFICLLCLKFSELAAPPNINLFCFNFGRICKSLFMFGFKFSKCYLDMMTSLVAYIIANAFYMWGFWECYGLMMRRKYHQDHMTISKALTLNLAEYRQLPEALYERINQYYEFNAFAFRNVEVHNDLYTRLPDVIRKEVTVYCYSKRIMRLPFFSGWPLDILERIVLLLKQDMYLAGDVVTEPWVSGDGLIIVDEGEVAVYTSNKQETGHLIDGDYYGELSLVTDKEMRMSYVIATTSCKILILNKTLFRILMREHVRLFHALKRHLLSKYKMNQQE